MWSLQKRFWQNPRPWGVLTSVFVFKVQHSVGWREMGTWRLRPESADWSLCRGPYQCRESSSLISRWFRGLSGGVHEELRTGWVGVQGVGMTWGLELQFVFLLPLAEVKRGVLSWGHQAYRWGSRDPQAACAPSESVLCCYKGTPGWVTPKEKTFVWLLFLQAVHGTGIWFWGGRRGFSS